MTVARRGGVLVRIDGTPAFVPATVAVKVAERPKIARLAGAPADLLGIALFEGALIPIITVVAESAHAAPPSLASPALLVCQCGGERIGLVGLDIVASGTFACARLDLGVDVPDNVADGGSDDLTDVLLDDGTIVKTFDVAELYARLQGARASLGVALPPPSGSSPRT